MIKNPALRTLPLCLMFAMWTGCGKDTSTVPYEEPPTLIPDAQGVYDLHLAPTEVKIGDKRYCLRGYNRHVPGPTIRIAAGTDRRVRVNLHNDLLRKDFREIAGMEGYAKKSCHDFNLTNLHAHGAHVQPNYATPLASD